MHVALDAGPLITACKFVVEGSLVIDHLLTGCGILITPSVEEEVAVLGARYPDGIVAGERIADGKIRVVSISTHRWARHLDGYAMGDGERDSIELCGQEPDVEALVTDEYLAFVTATRLGLQAWMLPDLIVELVSRGLLTARLARAILEAIQPRYRIGMIAHSLERLKEIENARSCSSS